MNHNPTSVSYSLCLLFTLSLSPSSSLLSLPLFPASSFRPTPAPHSLPFSLKCDLHSSNRSLFSLLRFSSLRIAKGIRQSRWKLRHQTRTSCVRIAHSQVQSSSLEPSSRPNLKPSMACRIVMTSMNA